MLKYAKVLLPTLACSIMSVWGRGYTFNPAMISGQNNDDKIDISILNQGGQLPGIYMVSVLVNGEYITTENINFTVDQSDENRKLSPCLSEEHLTKYGIDVNKFNGLFKNSNCANLNSMPQAEVDFNFNKQTLSLVVPQQVLLSKANNIALERQWEDGIPALFMNYNVTTQQRAYREENYSNSKKYYAQVQPGLNIGPWRLRGSASWQQENKWQRSYIYAERGINSLKSRVVAGESYSSGDVFNTVPFTGIKFTSDETMLADNQWRYAPVIRGMARSQARVEIQQNGYTLSNTLVPAGPFELTDLPTRVSGTDFKVIVHESDGTKQEFIVPNDTPLVAVRQGYLQYSLMAGRYRPANKSVQNQPVVGAEFKYGLPWDLTIFGGGQSAEHYTSGALGIGTTLGDFGAIAADVIHSEGKKIDNNEERGERWRLRYNKFFDTGTSFNMSSEEFASKGFSTLNDTLNSYCISQNNPYCGRDKSKPRNKVTLSLSQSLGNWGSLYINGYRKNYWDDDQNTTYISAGYMRTFSNGVSLGFDYSKTKNVNSYGMKRNDNLLGLRLSIPIENWLPASSSRINYQTTKESSGETTHEIGVSGNSLNNQLYWSLNERYRNASTNSKTSSAINLTYRGAYGELNSDYSQDSYLRQLGINVNGSMLFSQFGLTLGQTVGDTFALVQAEGVSGASVGYWPGMKTDFRGFTNYSSLTPYRKNNIDIDTATLPVDAELPQSSVSVVPTKGAVVLAKFNTRVGKRLILHLKRSDNKTVPFGSIAIFEGSQSGSGIVGDNGDVYLTGLPEKGTGIVSVKWGKEKNQSCKANIILPEKAELDGVFKYTSTCLINR